MVAALATSGIAWYRTLPGGCGIHSGTLAWVETNRTRAPERAGLLTLAAANPQADR